jgi:hypothetical protein
MSSLLLTKTSARALETEVARLGPHFGFFHASEQTQFVSWMATVDPPHTHREPFLVFALDTLPAYLRGRFGEGVTGAVQPHVLVRDFFLTGSTDKYPERIKSLLDFYLRDVSTQEPALSRPGRTDGPVHV